ncbi:hypothetical protein LguiB_025263 [Lonicera macranthoides]
MHLLKGEGAVMESIKAQKELSKTQGESDLEEDPSKAPSYIVKKSVEPKLGIAEKDKGCPVNAAKKKNNVAKATGEETTGICATDEDIKTLDIGIVLAPQVLEHLGTTRESSEIVPIIESTEETHRERGVDQSKMT